MPDISKRFELQANYDLDHLSVYDLMNYKKQLEKELHLVELKLMNLMLDSSKKGKKNEQRKEAIKNAKKKMY